MKELIMQILKMFAGKTANNIENGAAASNQQAANSAANDKIKDLAGSAVKSAIGGATQAAMSGASTAALGSMVSSYILPVIAGVIGLSALTVGGIALKRYIAKGPTIDNTANVVEKIRTISEFTSACYYEEAVLQQNKVEEGKQNKLMKLANIEADSVRSEVVILAKGTVRAGYNLSKIAADQIKVSGDSISLVVPKPEIFDVIVNPSDYEMYVEEGKWSHEEITALQANYREKLTANSLESGIIEKADKSGEERLKSMLNGLGFSYVEIIKSNE